MAHIVSCVFYFQKYINNGSSWALGKACGSREPQNIARYETEKKGASFRVREVMKKMEQVKMEKVTTNGPSCLICGEALGMKLISVNESTQEGYGYFYPTCDCDQEVIKDGEIINR